MAIHIIGTSREEEPGDNLLPEIDADLPPPSSAPANHLVLGPSTLTSLVAHKNSLVRAFAIEQIGHRDDPALLDALVDRIDDENPSVAAEAVGIFEHARDGRAVDRMIARFADAGGDLAAALATALGELAPADLVTAMKKRGRLDDQAHAAAASSLAMVGSDEAVGFLDAALNRAGAMEPERKSSLYASCLLSGAATLQRRVVGVTINESAVDEPPEGSFPSRAALAVVTTLPLAYSRRDKGLELFDVAREMLEAEALGSLDEAQRGALTEALAKKRPGDVLKSLAPILDHPLDPELSKVNDARTMWGAPERRRALLAALIDRADPIGALELNAAALFVAAAAKAVVVIVSGGGDESKSAAAIAIAKALGDTSAEALTEATPDALRGIFEEKTERDMRRVLSVLVRESFLRESTVERFFLAAVKAGHGAGLIDAVAESDSEDVFPPLLETMKKAGEAAETAVLEVLERNPLDDRSTPVALVVADQVRTERVGLVLGRRFLALRPHGRSRLSNAMLHVGDPRLIDVLEARAFDAQPEELAWALLALVHCAEDDERFERATQRLQAPVRDPRVPAIQLPMRCERCQEELWYTYEQVFLDPEAKEDSGDPAFAGDPVCKACGTRDRLAPTQEAQAIITNHLLGYLQSVRRGEPGPTIVTPVQVDVSGQRVGISEALRRLAKQIDESPSAIRPRLMRARLRSLLHRSDVTEDLESVLAEDESCLEAHFILATTALRAGNPDEAATSAARARRLLDGPDEVRLYEMPDASTMTEVLDDLLLDCRRRGATIPEDIDLSQAAARLEHRRRMAEEQESLRQGRPPPPSRDDPPAEAFRGIGRNDPCPCGSNKKFKRCHGARR